MGDDPLEPLRARFRARCREDLDILRNAMAAGDGLRGSDIQVLIHRLSGMAGSLGYPQLSQLAGGADAGLAKGLEPTREDLERLEAELARIAAIGSQTATS